MTTRFHPTWFALHLACVSMGAPLAAHAASIDCAKASTAIEATICEVPTLSTLDDRLNAAYQGALAREPAERQAQREWLANVRDRCEDQACLAAAYMQRLHEFETRTVARQAVPAAAANPLAVMMDVTYFYGESDLTLKHVMSNPDGVLFDKKIVDWTDADFALLEEKLKQQVQVEWDTAAARREKIAGMGYQAGPVENDHDYSFRKGVLDKVLASIPKYQYLASETHKKAEQDSVQAKAEAERQQALKAQEDEQRAAAVQARERQQEEAQAQTTRSNRTWIVLAIVAAALGAWVWNKFIRLRCARCKSTNIDTLAVNEVDRWRGTKQVSERNSRGTNTRHVSTTYVKNEYHYACRDCGEDWLRRKKEEL